MSAYGPQRIFLSQRSMSALGGKGGHAFLHCICPLMPQSGHRECSASVCYFCSSYGFDYLKDLKDDRGLTIALSQASDANITGRGFALRRETSCAPACNSGCSMPQPCRRLLDDAVRVADCSCSCPASSRQIALNTKSGPMNAQCARMGKL